MAARTTRALDSVIVSGGWVVTIVLGLLFGVGQLLLSHRQSFDIDTILD